MMKGNRMDGICDRLTYSNGLVQVRIFPEPFSPLSRALLSILTAIGRECTVVLLKATLYLKPCSHTENKGTMCVTWW